MKQRTGKTGRLTVENYWLRQKDIAQRRTQVGKDNITQQAKHQPEKSTQNSSWHSHTFISDKLIKPVQNSRASNKTETFGVFLNYDQTEKLSPALWGQRKFVAEMSKGRRPGACSQPAVIDSMRDIGNYSVALQNLRKFVCHHRLTCFHFCFSKLWMQNVAFVIVVKSQMSVGVGGFLVQNDWSFMNSLFQTAWLVIRRNKNR